VEQWKNLHDKRMGHILNQYLGAMIIRHVNFAFPHGEAARRYCLALGRSKPTYILPLLIEDQPCGNFGARLRKFVFCGRLAPEKEPMIAIKSFLSIFPELNPGTSLVMAGDGPLMAEARHLVNSHGNAASQAVDFIGAYRRNELRDILDHTSALLLPSSNEGWGLVALEAARLGRPMILSDSVGAAYDMVVQQENGFVFPTGDQVALAKAMLKLCRMNEKAFLHAQHLSRKIFEEWNNIDKADKILKICIDKRLS
jgi:glycosyltransferase involved in cell wall biosynthesis